MSTNMEKNHIDVQHSNLSTLHESRENLNRMFAFVALLTVVMFMVPSSGTEASGSFFIATASGLAIGCVLIVSHALLWQGFKAMRDDQGLKCSTVQEVMKADTKTQQVSVTPTHSASSNLKTKITQKVSKTDTKIQQESAPMTRSTSSRQMFAKPTREGRARQLGSQISEFCTLSFDDVDASEQSGLTCRMLALMNMLSSDVSYWRDEEKVEEKAFRILDLSDVDMRAIRCAVRAVADMVEGHKWRNAYDLLCALRPWFVASDSSSLELQRGRLRDDILALGLSQDGDDSADSAEKDEDDGPDDTSKQGNKDGRRRRRRKHALRSTCAPTSGT